MPPERREREGTARGDDGGRLMSRLGLTCPSPTPPPRLPYLRCRGPGGGPPPFLQGTGWPGGAAGGGRAGFMGEPGPHTRPKTSGHISTSLRAARARPQIYGAGAANICSGTLAALCTHSPASVSAPHNPFPIPRFALGHQTPYGRVRVAEMGSFSPSGLSQYGAGASVAYTRGVGVSPACPPLPLPSWGKKAWRWEVRWCGGVWSEAYP